MIDLREMFGKKGAPTLDLEKYCLYLFLHEKIKLGRYTMTNWTKLSVAMVGWMSKDDVVFVVQCVMRKQGSVL